MNELELVSRLEATDMVIALAKELHCKPTIDDVVQAMSELKRRYAGLENAEEGREAFIEGQMAGEQDRAKKSSCEEIEILFPPVPDKHRFEYARLQWSMGYKLGWKRREIEMMMADYRQLGTPLEFAALKKQADHRQAYEAGEDTGLGKAAILSIKELIKLLDKSDPTQDMVIPEQWKKCTVQWKDGVRRGLFRTLYNKMHYMYRVLEAENAKKAEVLERLGHSKESDVLKLLAQAKAEKQFLETEVVMLKAKIKKREEESLKAFGVPSKFDGV